MRVHNFLCQFSIPSIFQRVFDQTKQVSHHTYWIFHSTLGLLLLLFACATFLFNLRLILLSCFNFFRFVSFFKFFIFTDPSMFRDLLR